MSICCFLVALFCNFFFGLTCEKLHIKENINIIPLQR